MLAFVHNKGTSSERNGRASGIRKELEIVDHITHLLHILDMNSILMQNNNTTSIFIKIHQKTQSLKSVNPALYVPVFMMLSIGPPIIGVLLTSFM